MKNQAVSRKTPANPVIKQVKTLATHPMHASARVGAESVEYETRDRHYQITATVGFLPRSCDVPVLWALLGVLQSAQDSDLSIDAINVDIDDILDVIGKTRQTNNRRSVIEAIERYQEMRVEIALKNKKIGGGCVRNKFGLFSARIFGDRAVSISFDSLYLETLRDASPEEIRYMALEHVVRLSGVASQLYGILLGTLSREGNMYKVQVRQLARKLLGEERGGDRKTLPTSRFFSPYITDAIKEIDEKTNWKISCVKEGRGEDATVTFATTTIPVSDSAGGNVPNARAIASRKRPTPTAPIATESKLQIPAAGIPAPSLSDAVLSALPPEAAENRTFVVALASVEESEALAVIEYIKSKAPKSFCKYFFGITKNRTLKSLVAEISAEAKKTSEAAAANYRYALDTRKTCGEELFRKVCRHRGVTPEDAIAWAEENDPKLLATKTE